MITILRLDGTLYLNLTIEEYETFKKFNYVNEPDIISENMEVIFLCKKKGLTLDILYKYLETHNKISKIGVIRHLYIDEKLFFDCFPNEYDVCIYSLSICKNIDPEFIINNSNLFDFATLLSVANFSDDVFEKILKLYDGDILAKRRLIGVLFINCNISKFFVERHIKSCTKQIIKNFANYSKMPKEFVLNILNDNDISILEYAINRNADDEFYDMLFDSNIEINLEMWNKILSLSNISEKMIKKYYNKNAFNVKSLYNLLVFRNLSDKFLKSMVIENLHNFNVSNYRSLSAHFNISLELFEKLKNHLFYGELLSNPYLSSNVYNRILDYYDMSLIHRKIIIFSNPNLSIKTFEKLIKKHIKTICIDKNISKIFINDNYLQIIIDNNMLGILNINKILCNEHISIKMIQKILKHPEICMLCNNIFSWLSHRSDLNEEFYDDLLKNKSIMQQTITSFKNVPSEWIYKNINKLKI